MGKIVADRSGEVRNGVLFELTIPFDDASSVIKPSSRAVFVSRTPSDDELVRKGQAGYVWVECLAEDEDYVQEKHCLANSEHVTHSFYKRFLADINGGQRTSPFLSNTGVGCFAVIEELHNRLTTLKIKGARLDAIRINVNQSDWKDPKVWSLQFVGKASGRIPKLVDVANACPHCGRGQIVCPACGDWNAYCKSCKKYTVIIESEHGGKDDKQIPLESDTWKLVEGKTWDGSDLVQMNGRSLASKRFIDWLLRIHAAPFYAEPVLFAVDGMSAEQQKWLKELEKPLEG